MKVNLDPIKPLLRGIPFVFLVTFATISLVKKLLSYKTPLYSSVAKIKLASRKDHIAGTNLFKGFDESIIDIKVDAEIELFKSHLLLQRVIDSIDLQNEIYRIGRMGMTQLYKNSPIAVEFELTDPKGYGKEFEVEIRSDEGFTFYLPGEENGTDAVFGQALEFKYGYVIININDDIIAKDIDLTGRYKVLKRTLNGTVKALENDLEVTTLDKEVPIVVLKIKTISPQKSADILNTLAQLYIDENIATKTEAAGTTVRFLRKQLQEINADLENAENDVQRYRDDYNIVNIRQETETDLRKISQLKIQLSNIKMSLEAITDLKNYMNNGGDFIKKAPNFEAFTDLLSTELIKELKKLQSDRADLLLTYTETNDLVKVVDKKINMIRDYMIESISNTHKNLRTKYGELQKEIATSESGFVTIPQKEKELTSLQRNFEVLQSTYVFLSEKLIEAQIAESAKVSFHKIITPATISSKPSSPNYAVVTGAATLFSLVISIVLVYVFSYARDLVESGADIESRSNLAVIYETPETYIGAESQYAFNQNATKLELLELIPKGAVVSLSLQHSYDRLMAHIVQLAEAIKKQGKKPLVISSRENFDLSEIKLHYPKSSFMGAEDLGLKYFSLKSLRNTLDHLRSKYDVILIACDDDNRESQALTYMRSSDHKLHLITPRKSKNRDVTSIELIAEKYNLDSTWFILDRIKYKKGILARIWGKIRLYYKK